MADRKSCETFHSLIDKPWWEEKYAGLFHPACSLELPFAPPGMSQYFTAVERPIYCEWLSRTTSDWRFYEIEDYGAPEDTDIFWLMRKGECLAGWGGLKKQPFYSRFILKITIQDGLITGLKEYSDPIAWLTAAGREVPTFPMQIDPEAAERELPALQEKRNLKFACSDPPEVCEKRKARALEAFRFHRIDPDWADAVQEAPNMDGILIFPPPGMDENCTPHRQPGHLDWLEKCEVDSGYSANEFPVYATGNPDVFFDETCYHGLMHWPGAPMGRYRNTYIDRIIFDHGYVVEFSEALNPINKFNSINVSLPTFPYYFD